MDVIISDEALEDLDEIWKFVAKSPRASADRLLADLIRRCYSLEDHPDRLAAVPALKRDQVRRCTLRTWAIFFVLWILTSTCCTSFTVGRTLATCSNRPSSSPLSPPPARQSPIH